MRRGVLVIAVLATCLSGSSILLAFDTGTPPNSLTGYLEEWAVDERQPSGPWKDSLVQFLVDDEGTVHRLEDPANLLPSNRGRRRTVSGRSLGDRFVVNAVSEPASQPGRFRALLGPSEQAAATARGAQKTLVALMSFSDKPKPALTLDDVRDKVMTSTVSTNNFLLENSYRALWLEPDFIDWTDLPSPSSFYCGG